MNTPTPLPFQLTEFPPERFQILELLGQGGMGKVFKARDRHLNRPVALKFILSQETPNLLIRLVLEAQYQASLDHPHIVKVYGVGTWEGRTCVMMQLIAGTSLDQIAPSLSISKRVELLVQAARGIHAAHLHGLIHRDLKPQNILVETREGGSLHAFVMDFGLARATESESLTLSGAIMGSPHYMSPEQALGGRLVEARSDIYSLGATLYAAVVGAPPFSDSSDGKSTRLEFQAAEADLSLPEPGRLLPVPRLGAHALSVLRRVLDEEPVPPRRLNPDVSMDLETIILRCLEKDPAHRFPSAAALADDLECYLGGNPISARRASWPRRVRAWTRQNPTLSSVIAAGVVVGILALGASGIAMRRLRQKAEIAARFEQAAQQNEIRFRMGTLSPQQNRASEVTKLLAQMEAKKAEARAIGPMASGPGAFFQGRALLILGRNREALKELQHAWDQGFRSPLAAQALGSALLEVYFEESQRLTGGRQQREANRQILTQKYLHPAITCFQTGASIPERKNLYLAQIAYLEERDDAALELAGAELALTPWTVEAHRLRFLVWSRRAETAQDLATFENHGREAERHLQTLTEIARGDSRSHLVAAQWWIFKGGRLAFRYRVFQPELIQKGLDLATEASQLDPTSAAPFALRAEAWGRMADVLSLAERPASEIQKCNDQTLADADRALQLNPNSLNALLSKAFTKFLRTEAGMGKTGDLEEALIHVNQVIQIDDHASEAYRLKSLIHDFQAEEAALKDEDGRNHLQAWVSTSQELYRLWPGVLEHRIAACWSKQRLAFSDAHAGSPALARTHMQEARKILEEDLNPAPLPSRLCFEQIRLARLEGALDGLLGLSPGPAYTRAGAALNALTPELRQHPDGVDEEFTLCYERAAVDLGWGLDITAQITALQTVLDGWLKAKHSIAWFTANQIMLWRLRGLQDLSQGRSGEHWVVQGLKQIRFAREKAMTRMVEVWSGVEGALLVQSARSLGGDKKKERLEQGLRRLQMATAMDESLRWTFRQEFKMALEN